MVKVKNSDGNVFIVNNNVLIDSDLIEVLEISDDIKSLCISENKLISLPSILPSKLLSLDITNNKITSLLPLPTDLIYLFCGYNQLTSLPTDLPTNLIKLICHNNKLCSLPSKLPNVLMHLSISSNELTSLGSELPINLHELCCERNKLTKLPDLRQCGKLKTVRCDLKTLNPICWKWKMLFVFLLLKSCPESNTQHG